MPLYIFLGACVVFLGLGVLAARGDKNRGQDFLQKIRAQYPAAEAFGMHFVTEEGIFFYYCPSGFLPEYRKFDLSRAAYVGIHGESCSLLDANRNVLRGELLSPVAKPYSEVAPETLPIGGDMEDFVAFLQRYAGQLKCIRE